MLIICTCFKECYPEMLLAIVLMCKIRLFWTVFCHIASSLSLPFESVLLFINFIVVIILYFILSYPEWFITSPEQKSAHGELLWLLAVQHQYIPLHFRYLLQAKLPPKAPGQSCSNLADMFLARSFSKVFNVEFWLLLFQEWKIKKIFLSETGQMPLGTPSMSLQVEKSWLCPWL